MKDGTVNCKTIENECNETDLVEIVTIKTIVKIVPTMEKYGT